MVVNIHWCLVHSDSRRLRRWIDELKSFKLTDVLRTRDSDANGQVLSFK